MGNRRFKQVCKNCGAEYLSQKPISTFCSISCGAVFRKGIQRNVSAMREGLNKWKRENPEQFIQVSLGNLPKNCSGENNGNWKGGKTKEYRNFRIQNYKEYKEWRRSCLKRDNCKCKLCGSQEDLQVHHVIPISENRYISWEVWNGVTLCKKCHYDNDSCWKDGKRFEKVDQILGKPTNRTILIYTIRPEFQEYQTAGNYKEVGDNLVVFLISEQDNENYEFLIVIHEMIEYFICKRRGISEKVIDKYDKDWEEKTGEKADEPGNEKDAPYYKEHRFAENIERLIAHELGIDWFDYNNNLKIK